MHSGDMAKRKDPVETARSIFDEFLSISDPDSATEKPELEPDDPAKKTARRKGGKIDCDTGNKKQSSRKRKTR
jgi:hypothetical protein